MSGDRILRRGCLACRCFSDFDVWPLEAGCYGITCLTDGWVYVGLAYWQTPRCQKTQDEDRSRIEPPKSPSSSLHFLLPLLRLACCFREWIAMVSGALEGDRQSQHYEAGGLLIHIQLWKIVSLSSVSCYHLDSKLPLDSASWPGLILILASW